MRMRADGPLSMMKDRNPDYVSILSRSGRAVAARRQPVGRRRSASRPLRVGRAPIAGVRKFCRISFHTGVQHVLNAARSARKSRVGTALLESKSLSDLVSRAACNTSGRAGKRDRCGNPTNVFVPRAHVVLHYCPHKHTFCFCATTCITKESDLRHQMVRFPHRWHRHSGGTSSSHGD
jgi:hypothetical protein